MSSENLKSLVKETPHRIALKFSESVVSTLKEIKCFVGGGTMKPDENRTLILNKNVAFESYTSIDTMYCFNIGSFSYSNSTEHKFSVGRYCSIGRGVFVLGERHPIEHVTTSNITYMNRIHFELARKDFGLGDRLSLPDRTFDPEPTIGHDVWIAPGTTLARGITIGTGAIIAANSHVVKNVAPYEIVGGNPAQHIRWRFPEPIRTRLLTSEWWNYHPKILLDLNHKNPSEFLKNFDIASARGSLEKISIKKWDWISFIKLIKEIE